MPHDRFIVGSKDETGISFLITPNLNILIRSNNPDYYSITSPTAFNLSDLYIKQYNASLSLSDSGMKIIDPADPGIFYANSAIIAVDSDWVEWNNPGIWETLYEPVTILHIDDNGNGEVLNTTHLYYDPEKNLDVFDADSPDGLSEFALATVSRSGNPLQLLYLSILSRVSPSSVNAKTQKPFGKLGGGGGGKLQRGCKPCDIIIPIPDQLHHQAHLLPVQIRQVHSSSPGLNSPAEPGNSAKAPYVAVPKRFQQPVQRCLKTRQVLISGMFSFRSRIHRYLPCLLKQRQ